MTSLEILPCLPEHLPAIQEIYAKEVLHGFATFEEVPPSVEEMTQRYQTILSLGFPYLIAKKDDTIAGYAYISKYRERLHIGIQSRTQSIFMKIFAPKA